MTENRRAGRRKVALALQGGGSHGAFTWGVLDRLLEDPTLDIVGFTGTSAGAMNAVVAADGLLSGGPEGGRQRLRVSFGKQSARCSDLELRFGLYLAKPNRKCVLSRRQLILPGTPQAEICCLIRESGVSVANSAALAK
jgi:predicted acylesterase/phospholipase RssA